MQRADLAPGFCLAGADPTEQTRRLAARLLSAVTRECAGENLIDCVDAVLFVAAHLVNFAAIECGADVAHAFTDAREYFAHLAARELRKGNDAA